MMKGQCPVVLPPTSPDRKPKALPPSLPAVAHGAALGAHEQVHCRRAASVAHPLTLHVRHGACRGEQQA